VVLGYVRGLGESTATRAVPVPTEWSTQLF
jgi:hypothetical protein